MNLLRLLPRFRAADRAIGVFAAREEWSRSNIEAFQLERLNSLWQQAIEHVPYYAELQRERQLSTQFASLDAFREQVPVLTKVDLRRAGPRLFSGQATRGDWNCSSGSTGSPTTAFWGNAAKSEMLAAKYRFYADWDIDYFDRCVFVWGNLPAPGLRTRVSDRLRNRLRLAPYRLTLAVLREQLRRIAAFGPALLYAYTSCAYLLAQEAAATGFRCPDLKLVNYSAEPGLPRLVRGIEAGFGVPAVGEYGSTECGFIAGEDRSRRLRVRDDIVLLETTPRADGRYDIIVTPLTNPSFPLVRYQLGDTTTAPLARPECGLSVLTNVAGRMNDLLVTAGGNWLSSDLVELLFEDQPWVRRFTVHQAASGAVLANVEAHAPASTAQVSAVRRQLAELLEGYPVTVEVRDELPQHPSGKHRWITSDMSTPASLAPAEQSEFAATQ